MEDRRSWRCRGYADGLAVPSEKAAWASVAIPVLLGIFACEPLEIRRLCAFGRRAGNGEAVLRGCEMKTASVSRCHEVVTGCSAAADYLSFAGHSLLSHNFLFFLHARLGESIAVGNELTSV